MSALTNRVAGTGLFALDVIVRSDGSTAKPALGGSAGNVLSILGALGWTAVPIGATGDDAAAGLLSETFNELGADLSFFRRSKHQCTPVIYQHQLEGSASSTHRFTFACPTCGERRRPSWKGEQSLFHALESLPVASVFFLDRPTELGVTLAQRYADQGTLVVFEPSSFGDDPALFQRALRAAHIVKYADERIDELDYNSSMGTLVEIQTRGAEGLRFRAPSLGSSWMSMGAYSLPYIWDTSGAGDWCTAGLIYELFRLGGISKMTDYATLVQALAFGQALSSLNCLTEGARGLLAAWSSRKIVNSAQELCGRRLESLGRTHSARCVDEPRLAELAFDIRTASRSGQSIALSVCCSL